MGCLITGIITYMKYYGSKLYGWLEKKVSEKSTARIPLTYLLCLILVAKHGWSWLAMG